MMDNRINITESVKESLVFFIDHGIKQNYNPPMHYNSETAEIATENSGC